ncbi:MAG TPA: ABC transporter, partial [Sphingobacterium sp.]|nr:ABC transporter [Sphingobacterium sp.]
GLIEDFTGTVEVNGINIQEDPLAVKALLGYVPENAELYDVLTPMEYLDFIGKLYGMEDNLILERSLKLLTAFGLESNANNRMDTFSKGMRQKVLLISGIIHNPQIIVLDEPLSGLDANAVIFVKELISLLAKEGKTIFYCSHMMDVVEKVSDRILLINQGSIIADGTIEELKTDPNESLEHIFAKLTNTGNSALDASNIITAIQ